MESLLQLIKALLNIFSKKRERVTIPKRLTEEGQEVSVRPPESIEELVLKEPPEIIAKIPASKYLWCDSEKIPIQWDKVITHKDDPQWSLPRENMRLQFSGRRVEKFVVHWDGCLDSKMCHKVLKSRGLSVHFCIDNDGTIIQLMDTNHIAWHARGVNSDSIGVEMSNAVYTKYAKKYDPRRPVLESVECHRKQIGPILGFTDEQVKALKVLTKTICKEYKIPLQVPENEKGELIKGVIKASEKHPKGWRMFKGVMAHYHLNKNKTDPAGLDLKEVVKDETK